MRPAIRSLSKDAGKTLVHVFIACHLDYCNSVFFGISNSLQSSLQSVHNAAAELITGAWRHDHVTLVIRQLHWLPVQQRVAFKARETTPLVGRWSNKRVDSPNQQQLR